MAALSQLALHDTAGADYDTLLGGTLSRHMDLLQMHGFTSYQPLTPEALSQYHAAILSNAKEFEQLALLAPDLAKGAYWAYHPPHHGISWPRIHLLPEFDKSEFAGKSYSKLINSLEAYDFDKFHSLRKSQETTLDIHLFGALETGVLLWSGDVEVAKAGWWKQIEARKRIKTLVQKGERSWDEYWAEELAWCPTLIIGGLLAAGEIDLLRELIPHTLIGIALLDPLVASQMEKIMSNNVHFSWKGPDGYCFWRMETLMLQARALAAIVDDGKVDAEALEAWLPRPDELIYIAERECMFICLMSGKSHPALLCATLYATRLGAWNDAEAIVKGVLAIPPLGDGKGFGMQPLVRIEAWRLLAQCRGARREADGACEALEEAARESRAASYVWMEAESLRDMLQWVTGDAEEAFVRKRISAVTSEFVIRNGKDGVPVAVNGGR